MSLKQLILIEECKRSTEPAAELSQCLSWTNKSNGKKKVLDYCSKYKYPLVHSAINK